MSFWSEAAAQQEAVAVLSRASDPQSEAPPAHAWLLTGPPGSGRSNLAFRFAAALIARTEQEREQVFERVRARSHPDLGVLSTQNVQIDIRAAREVVLTAFYAPAEGRYRVIVIEDADRMPERTSNVLLKALEEPPERTIWVLCAPSEADLLPTIRSRTQSVRLVTPSLATVSELLQQREGVSAAVAERCARLAQCHVGMARRLAVDVEALARRERTVQLFTEVSSLSGAMEAAAEYVSMAEADAQVLAEAEGESERREAARLLGVREGEAVPRQVQAQLRAAETDHKRRQERALRDAYDRLLVDILGITRDVSVLALAGAGEGADAYNSGGAEGGMPGLINEEWREQLAGIAARLGQRGAIALADVAETARRRLHARITPALVMESLLAGLLRLQTADESRARAGALGGVAPAR